MKRIRLSRILVIVIVLSILLTSVMISSLWIYYTYSEFKSDSAMAEKIYMQNKKELLRQRIESVVRYIDNQRKEWFINMKDDAINKTFTAYLTAYNMYNKYKNKNPQNEIKGSIINFFESLELCKKGCFFIYDKKTGKLYDNDKIPIPPSLTDIVKNTRGLERFVHLRLKNTEIFGYIKLFEPFGWYIGYIRLIKAGRDDLKAKIIKYLFSYRFDHNKHGYIFALKLLNPDNGSCFAKMLVNPNNSSIVGKCLSDKSGDPNDKYFKKHLGRLIEKGHEMLEYNYKIPGTNKIGKKLSYMVLYKPWNWIIGTGYYIKDLKQSFMGLKMEGFEKNLYKKVAVIVAISVAILLLLLIIYLFFYNLLSRDVKFVEDFFKTYPMKKRIDTDTIKIEDVYEVASKINEMAEKIDVYSKTLRESFEKYHGLMSYMPDCVVIFKGVGKKILIDEINDCIETLLSKKRMDILGKSVDEAFKDIPALPEKVYSVFESRVTVESFECVKKASKNEPKKYCSCIAYSLKDDKVVAILKDVTDNVLLFRKIERRQKQMETFINTVNAGIIVSSEDGEIVYINNMAKKVLDLKDTPTKKDIFKAIGRENILALRNKLSILKNKKGAASCENCNIKIKTNTGEEKWLDLSVGSIEFDDREMFVVSFYDITKRYLKEKEIEYISFHDSLTGLYNRRYFEEELNRLFNSRNYPLALIIYDLNGLKIVNDALGHKVGDDLIKRFGKILLNSSRLNDVAARIGGDEFAVIMPNTDKIGAEVFISRVNREIELSNKDKNSVLLSVSYGYAMQSDKIKTATELFTLADSAMYKNKYKNRNRSLSEVLISIRNIKNKA